MVGRVTLVVSGACGPSGEQGNEAPASSSTTVDQRNSGRVVYVYAAGVADADLERTTGRLETEALVLRERHVVAVVIQRQHKALALEFGDGASDDDIRLLIGRVRGELAVSCVIEVEGTNLAFDEGESQQQRTGRGQQCRADL